jgi:hypothetical protein
MTSSTTKLAGSPPPIEVIEGKAQVGEKNFRGRNC